MAPAAAQVIPLVEARALDRVLDYAVPADLDDAAVPGALVACPLGRRRVLGVVVGRAEATHEGRLAPLAGVVDTPPVAPDLLDLALWMARYYLAPRAACLRLVLPPGADGALRRRPDGSWVLGTPPRGPAERLVARSRPGAEPPERPRWRAVAESLAAAGGRLTAADLCRRAGTTLATVRRMADAGVIDLASEAVAPRALETVGGPPPAPDEPPALTGDQADALAAAEAAMADGGMLLLHGVTGSGKTEVYLRAIASARARGRGSIVLVPEIALTPQLLGRLRARLGERIAVWHSALSPSERAEEHRRVREGDADVVLGARSAVFAPVGGLGLVIVDEEHDSSYKQDAAPRYDARQVAARRARAAGAAVVYGTATPRPETWHALPRRTLRARPDGSPLPRVEIVDMRDPGGRAGVAAAGLGAARGGRPRREGGAAGEPARFRADGPLPLLRVDRPLPSLRRRPGPPRGPPAPGVPPLRARGGGARRVPAMQGGRHRAARRGKPGPRGGAPAARAGRPPRAHGRLQRPRGAAPSGRLLADFARPGAAILLGTQMVAKGHDLPEVTVAAAIDADAPLQHAGFRAEERAFGLIVQLAGRAGRRGEPARVIVQAYEPAARAVQLGARHAVEEFLEGEVGAAPASTRCRRSATWCAWWSRARAPPRSLRRRRSWPRRSGRRRPSWACAGPRRSTACAAARAGRCC